MCTHAHRFWLVPYHRRLSPCTPGMHTHIYTHHFPSLTVDLSSPFCAVWLLPPPSFSSVLLPLRSLSLSLFLPDPPCDPLLPPLPLEAQAFFPDRPHSPCPSSLLGPIVWASDLSASHRTQAFHPGRQTCLAGPWPRETPFYHQSDPCAALGPRNQVSA